MIAVIADDFTGAAELAGISLRYGLTVELFVDNSKASTADVVIVSTDSRSLKKDKALAVTENVLKQVLQLQPSMVYKKVDSVLRGYVLDELKVQMKLMNKKNAFIMPANPSLGRTIKDGKYWLNGIAIDKTAFANDPEFPIQTADVKEILNNEVKVLKHDDDTSNGIVAGEVERVEDYDYWANNIENKALVGAGDFFMALLNKNFKPAVLAKADLQKPFLYVSGTAFKERKGFLKSLKCVLWMPEKITEQWINQTSSMLNQQQKAVIAIDESSASPVELRDTMAEGVKILCEKAVAKELFIEGGSTAAAVLKKMNITNLQPVNELSRGVVRMKSGDLFITVKPGSYELPDEIKRLFTT